MHLSSKNFILNAKGSKMTRVELKKKLSGLFPDINWGNSKRHISALVKGGKVIAYSECSLGGMPKFCSHKGRSCHSEMNVIKNMNIHDIKRKISKYVIYNIRWSKDGRIVNSKPCLNCQQELLRLGFKTIIFSNQDGTFEKNKLSHLSCSLSSGSRY